MNTISEQALNQYAAYMREILDRTAVIGRALSKHREGSSLTGFRESDIELCFLQLRKCLEIVMFAALVAQYHSGVGLQSRLLNKEYNATKLMNYLRRVNPDFFPKAVKVFKKDGEAISRMEDILGAMTQQEFAALYDQVCGPYLHASRRPAFVDKHDVLMEKIRDSLTKLVLLLNSHWITLTAPNKTV